MAVEKLNEKTLTRLTRPERLAKLDPRGKRYHDSGHEGFGCTIYPTGRVAFWIVYGPRHRRHRLRIGLLGQVTLTQALEIAKDKLADFTKGRDPAADQAAREAVPTFAEWAATYLEAVSRRKKAPYADRRYLIGVEGKRGHEARTAEALARWGRRPLTEITTGDVQALIEDQAKAGHPTQANRMLASIRACLAAAWRAGHVPENVALRVKAFPEAPPRSRVLSDAELKRFAKALAADRNPYKRAAFTLLLETGARKSEVLGARWADVDLDGATWAIPSPKAGTPQVVPLANSTVAMLRGLKRVSLYVIPGRYGGRPLSDLRSWWDDLREKAKLPDDVTIHDLRRGFGLRVAKAAGLHVASKLLRHADVRVTERVYAPLTLADLREPAEQAANVIPWPKRRARK